jgi:cytochrome c553
MSKTLALLFALAACLPAARAQDAQAGQQKVAMCIGCHGIPGYQASFPEVYKVPAIAGQGAKYIVTALTAYRKGDRKHPTMRAIAGSMSDQDIADVAAYYEQLGQGAAARVDVAAHAPSAEVDALLKKGACASCHGADFAKPIDPSYPKIAGQYPDYLYAALKAYQTTGNPQVGRGNAIMGGVAKQFSHAELKALAGYIGAMPGPLTTVPQGKFR